MAWIPQSGGWPILNIAFHLKSSTGSMIEFDGDRIGLPSTILPHETAKVVGVFTAPTTPGDYLLTWDIVSEGECWFERCGSEILDTAITVIESAPKIDS